MEVELRKINLVPENDPVLFISPTVWDFDNPQFDPKQFNILMLENMVVHEGLGLSANQIGIPFQVFAMRVDDDDHAIVCYNPNIVKESEESISMKEGCLSYPNLFLNIWRSKEVVVEYQNADGEMVDAHFDGLAARVFQHEMDHMKGNTFLPKVSKFALQSARKKQRILLRKEKRNGRTN